MAKPKREDAVKFIKEQLENPDIKRKNSRVHYGLIELRDLLDFIYGGPPKREKEELKMY